MNRLEKSTEIKLADVEHSLGLSAFKTLPNSYGRSSGRGESRAADRILCPR